MSMAIAIGRTRTVLDKVTRSIRKRSGVAGLAETAWASVRPRLDLTRDMASDNRRSLLARNVLDSHLPSPVRYLEIGSFEGGSLAFLHALLSGKIAATCIDPFVDYGELPTTDMRPAA